MDNNEAYNENYRSFEGALITVWDIITEITSGKNDMLFEIADVYDEAQWKGLIYNSVEKAVMTLNRMGLLAQPENGKYKRVYR